MRWRGRRQSTNIRDIRGSGRGGFGGGPRMVRRAGGGLGTLIVIVAVALFPFGSIESHHLPFIAKRWVQGPEDRIVHVRESAAQTLMYVELRAAGEVHSHRLLTNALSMAGNYSSARRYSKLYVYLPVAIHPDPRNALVISFGLGSTAKAVTDTASFEHVDVVDISKDILELSRIVYEESEHPLRDPRVEVHIEDGRYFLQATDRRFDLITGEPPPPNAAGVANLYTREYFALARERLNEGGMISYWLPIHSVPENGSLAVIRSFCDVFEDCTLWNGTGRDLMLVGSRNATRRVTGEHFRRQWSDPAVRDELVALGFERPEQLGALFIAGAAYLKDLTRDVAPLVDDFPKRILGPPPDLQELEPLYRTWTDTARARERFEADPFVATLWPPSVREASLPYFAAQQIINDQTFGLRPAGESLVRDTIEILTETDLVAPALWMMGTNADLLRIAHAAEAKGRDFPNLDFYRGVEQIAHRRFANAPPLFERSERNPHNFTVATSLRILALCAAGRPDEARALAVERRPRMPRDARVDDFFDAVAGFCEGGGLEVAYTPD